MRRSICPVRFRRAVWRCYPELHDLGGLRIGDRVRALDGSTRAVRTVRRPVAFVPGHVWLDRPLLGFQVWNVKDLTMVHGVALKSTLNRMGHKC